MEPVSSHPPIPNDKLAPAVVRLRQALNDLKNRAKLQEIGPGRDEVIGQYGTLFSPQQLPDLTDEKFRSFLRFENNRHWTGIERQGPRITADMPALREVLAQLQDESRPLADRYNEARQRIKGLGKATITPILLVTRPQQYGVWNAKSESGLKLLGLWPSFRKESEGQQYEAMNAVLLQLAGELGIDLWTLDILWDVLSGERSLAAPFDAIFPNRTEAETAFGHFAETVNLLGGSPTDKRFALTLRYSETLLRLNFGQWLVLDYAKNNGFISLTLLIQPTESQFDFKRGEPFADDPEMAVFEIPFDVVADWPDELQAIYEASMARVGERFHSWKGTPFKHSHLPTIFAALFDEKQRDELFDKGLKPPARRYWRITMPADMSEDMGDGRGSYNFWADCLERGLAAIGFDNDLQNTQVEKFASIRVGDGVVAFLRNKSIGGIGVVTSELDESVALERPAEQDYFRDDMWLRIGVAWQPKTLSVDKLSPKTRNKFLHGTVIELREAEYGEVEALFTATPADPNGKSIAREFHGFSADAFAFLSELQANNTKEWMDAHRERWQSQVLEPMRALFADLGPALKPIFDPYLSPDTLETRATAHQVLARIYKNWAATVDSQYHGYYWGAFYRESLSRQTDAQLFIVIYPHVLRFGFFVGRQAKQVRDRFRLRVLEDTEGFYALLDQLRLRQDFEFVRTHDESKREVIVIREPDDLRAWVASGDFDLLQPLAPTQVIGLGPALADRIYDAFRRAFPIYLWAVADDPKPLVERYLAIPPSPDDDNVIDEIQLPLVLYTDSDFRARTHLDDATAAELLDLLRDKRQLIFDGPPGTGKTWVARELAKQLIGLAEPPPERLEIVQFHPAYSYEDFIEGIRPQVLERDGRYHVDYPPREGTFVRFCRRAAGLGDDTRCVFIIDEINRGNIPRIFGELMLLLEYRDQDVTLPYSGRRFRIPPNVYLIGTMNTADRSIALVDFALRRRFHFFHFQADPDLFDRWLSANGSDVPYLGRLYRRLATEGVDDSHYAVGPSYFMRPGLDEPALERIWRRSIIPYLEEYHYEQPEKAQRWRWDGDLVAAVRREE